MRGVHAALFFLLHVFLLLPGSLNSSSILSFLSSVLKNGLDTCPPVNNVTQPSVCNLRISEFSFAGSHNSAAGAYGAMNYNEEVVRIPGEVCRIANQRLSIQEQLDIGVRALDIDTIYKPSSKSNEGDKHSSSRVLPGRLMSGHCHEDRITCGVGVPLERVFGDVKTWLDKDNHGNDVIILRLKDYTVLDQQENGYKVRRQIAEGILHIIETTIGLDILNYDVDPTLSSVILSKRVVFLYLNTDIWTEISRIDPRKMYIRPNTDIDTYSGLSLGMFPVSAAEEKSISYFRAVPQRLRDSSEVVTLDWYGMGAQILLHCTEDLAKEYRDRLNETQSIAHFLLTTYNRTINVIFTDFVSNSVVDAVKKINLENVKFFNGRRH